MRKIAFGAAVASLVIGCAGLGLAAEQAKSPGAAGSSPGHEMQEHGRVPGQPGASGFAPGHNMIDRDDHATTGSGGQDIDRDARAFKKRDPDGLGTMRDSDDRARDIDK